jgi:ABC-2 type transport system permease protein
MSQSIAVVPDFFSQLFGYREYLIQSVARDLKNKYKRSVLGYLWTMLHPLGMMAVLAIVFSQIMRLNVEDYAGFLLVALLPWNFFSSTLLMNLNSIRANARLFGQVPVPKYIFVLSITASNFINYILALIPLFIILLVSGQSIHWTVLLFPIVVLPLLFITVGLSLILSGSNVFFDDTFHLSEVAVQALYFLSPVLYGREHLPGELARILVAVNPLFCQMEFLRDIFYYGRVPNMEIFAINLGISFIVFFFGLKIFKSVENKFLYFV